MNEKFHINLRKTRRGLPEDSFTVHRDPPCKAALRHMGAAPAPWEDVTSDDALLSVATRMSIGACKTCWGDEAIGQDERWQSRRPQKQPRPEEARKILRGEF